MVKADHKIQSQPSKAMPSSPPPISSSSSSSSYKKKYKGVRMRSWGSWVSEIRAPNQKTRIWLGSYSTPEAAARAYDAALLCLKGTSANLNFPITSSHYIPDSIMSPKSIQRVAAAAANNFLDNSTTPPSPTNPPSSSSSSSPSSSISSPSMSSSSPSDQLDDDISLMPSFGSTNYSICEASEQILAMATPWYEYNFGLQSPKYTDQMFSNGGASFDPPMLEDFNEEGDIRLWSFC